MGATGYLTRTDPEYGAECQHFGVQDQWNQTAQKRQSWSMRRTRTCFILLATMMIGFLAVPVAAAPIHGKKILAPNPATDWLLAKVRDSILKRLDLTDEQLWSIHEVFDDHRDVLWDELEMAKGARLSLVDQMREVDLDTAAIRRAHAEVAETELQLLLHTAVVLQEINEYLTPEQLAEVDLLVEEFWEGAELRFADLEEVFANGELLGKKWRARASRSEAR